MMDSDPICSLEKLEQQLVALDENDVCALAQRLEEDDYVHAFASLQDWHLLRALAIHRPDLVVPYRHLIDQEAFDED